MLRKALACKPTGVHISERDTEPGDRLGEKRMGGGDRAEERI